MRCEIIVLNEYKNDTEADKKDKFLELLAAYITRQESKVS